MEIQINNGFNHTTNNQLDDDALSLRNLQFYDQTAASSTRSSPRASSGHELFEFFPNLDNSTAAGDVVFCGKVISDSDNNCRENRMLVGSSSLRLPDRRTEDVIPMRSVSDRDLGSPRHGVRLSTSVYKKGNVTALTSKSSKRRMFMLGPVKFMPEMEMSSIKERQLRRTPSRMFPVVESGGDVGKTVTGTVKNQRVRCRARLNSVFERSFACLRI